MKKISLLLTILFFTNFNILSQDKSIKDKIINLFSSNDTVIYKTYKVLKGFTYSNKTISLKKNFEKITLMKKEDGTYESVVLIDNNSKPYYYHNSDIFYSNSNIYIIDNDKKLTVFNIRSEKNGELDYKLLLHSLKFSSIVKDEIERVYFANSCYVKKRLEDGSYESNNYIFNDFLPNKTKQLILKGSNFIYVYKININQNGIDINTESEPIFRFQLSHHYNLFKKSVIESIILNEKQTVIEKFSTEFLNFDYDINDIKFEWDSNNNEQIYSIRKVGILNTILNEI